MRIDPVVALADDIDHAYLALARARDTNDWAATRRHLARIAALHEELRRTVPATVIGAAYLLREAASLLPGAREPECATRLKAVAARFNEGIRRFEDIVWLRQTARELVRREPQCTGQTVAGLIALALMGAARPVLLYRAVTPMAVQRSAPPAGATRHLNPVPNSPAACPTA